MESQPQIPPTDTGVTGLNTCQGNPHSIMSSEKDAAPETVPELDTFPFAPLLRDNSFAYPSFPQSQWGLLNNNFQVPQQTSNPPDNLSWPDFELDQAFPKSLDENQVGNIPFPLYDDSYTNSIGGGVGLPSVVRSAAFDNWVLDQRLFASDSGPNVPSGEDGPEPFDLNDILGGFSNTTCINSVIPLNLHGNIAVSSVELPLPDAFCPIGQDLPPEFWEMGPLPSSILQETEVTSAGVTFNPAFGRPAPLTFGDEHHVEFSSSGTRSTPSTDISASMSEISSTPQSGESWISENIDRDMSHCGTQSNKPLCPLTFMLNVSRCKEDTGRPSNSPYTLQSGLGQFHTGRVRKQFSKDRRKEIAVTRGVGACFPCRMFHVTVSVVWC
jgi:hypothetical protein